MPNHMSAAMVDKPILLPLIAAAPTFTADDPAPTGGVELPRLHAVRQTMR